MGKLIAKMGKKPSAKKGAKVFKTKCSQCHTVEEEELTSRDQTFTDSSDASLDRLRDTPTLLLTRSLELPGEKIPFSTTLRTQRSTSREPRWFSLESKRLENVKTSSLTLRRAALHKYLEHTRYVRGIALSVESGH